MKPDIKEGRRIVRKKRNHKIKCLRCLKVFLSRDLKLHRICDGCKRDFWWRTGEDSDI